MPKTIRVKTGGGGEHIYFRLPAGDRKWPKELAEGIDLKGEGGQVVAPDSIHPDGGVYRFQDGFSPWDVELADLPEWIATVATAKAQTKPVASVDVIPAGERNDRLFAEARKLASMGWDEKQIYEALSRRNQEVCNPPLADVDIQTIAAQGPKYAVQPATDLGTTDTDNAKRLVRRHGSDIRFVRTERSGTWYVYNGILWDPSPSAETAVLQKAEDTARGIANEAILQPDQGQAKSLLEHAKRSLNRGRFIAMVDQTKHQKEIAATLEDFNTNDYLINLDNGTYDLKAHRLQEHDPTDMITKTVGYDFDHEAVAPRWKKFLDEIFEEDREVVQWVQCLLGMSLTAYTGHQFVVFMTGRGSNGKSVLLETMTKVLGDYASKCNNVLFKSTKSDNEKGYILGSLRDIRFSYASELNEGESLASATIKEITGGETVFSAGDVSGVLPDGS